MTKEEAIQILRTRIVPTMNWQEIHEATDMAIEALSAERTGEWIIWNEPGNKCVYCTKCKHEYDQIDLYIGGSEYPNYCPNCGADMRRNE